MSAGAESHACPATGARPGVRKAAPVPVGILVCSQTGAVGTGGWYLRLSIGTRAEQGKMVTMTSTGGPVAGQLDLFGDAVADAVPEPVLMALHVEYYDLIWQRLKTHEFRRRFLEGRPVRWFVYLNAPVSRLAAVIDLGPAEVGSPEEVAEIAERMRPGNGASVLEYVRDLDRAFAIPILGVSEYPGLSAEELRTELGAFHPPQGYVRLAQHPELMAVCEKAAAEVPIRSITVHHRLYRFRCGRQRPALGGGCRCLGVRPIRCGRILRCGGRGRRGTGRSSGRLRRSTCGLRVGIPG
jgi:predicted transcriptional regulator